MSTISGNQLLAPVEYKIDETSLGTWRSYLYPSGELFREFVSHSSWGGIPLVHYTSGKCPETGRRITAKGIVAIGKSALGVLAIGQAALGVVAVGQLAIGVVLGLGQASTGILALGQLAIALAVGIGQFSAGMIAVGQFALGYYALAQIGWGWHVWDTNGVSLEAERFFRALMPK